MSESQNVPEYTPHPFTEIFPPMSDDERKALEESIKKNCLREEITVNPQKQILDGVNRYRACLAVGVEPRFEVREDLITDDAILIFMSDRNAVRRHLPTAVRAALGAELIARKRDGNSQKITDAAAAQALGISPSSLAVVKAIRRTSRDLHAILRAGGISINAAEAIAKLEEPERSTKVGRLKELLAATGPKETNRTQRAHRNGTAKPKSTGPSRPLEMIGTDPLTGKQDQPLTGPYNIILHVARAIPVFGDELGRLRELTKDVRLSESNARQLKSALKPLRKVDYDALLLSVDTAISELEKIVKAEDENDATWQTAAPTQAAEVAS